MIIDTEQLKNVSSLLVSLSASWRQGIYIQRWLFLEDLKFLLWINTIHHIDIAKKKSHMIISSNGQKTHLTKFINNHDKT